MAGTWDAQNKVLAGAYMNIRTNEALSITVGERGTCVILQELTVGTDDTIYEVKATESNLPTGATTADKKLANEALKNAYKVLVYKLPTSHDGDDIDTALTNLKTVNFDVLCYPYTTAANENKIVTWIKSMNDDEGLACQAVMENIAADSEYVINVVQGVTLNDSTTLTAAEVTAWVAGAAAGASITTSNTGKKYVGAIDISPKMTKSEMETAVTAGKFIFKVDNSENVTCAYDINSLTSTSATKGAMFKKNRVLRTVSGIRKDITSIFESSYVGKINNNADGRNMLKAALCDYFNTLQNMQAIQNFVTDDVIVTAGTAIDAVVVEAYIQPVDSIEKIYINVNLS